jgi:hypothetical protein
VLLPSAVLAQGATSVLIGNVVDASTKAPVPDVVVTATSPSLQGEQVVVTDATGLYRVPQLPPGVYTLRFEKESFRPYSREQIDVAADRTLRLNVELLPEVAGAETVTVIGTAPTIDVGSSATGTTVSQEFVKNLAVARPGGLGGANRSFDSLAQTAPQANPDVYGVGINGATSPENLYLIDGLSVNNPGYGTLGTPLTAEFMDEVNVVTGGYMPEYGRTTGGAISAVTKSGGSEFHGSVFGTFSPGSLTGASGQIPSNTPVINARRDIGNIGDVGATLGGYILPDRLWFFAGFQFAKQRYVYYRSFNQLQGTTVVPIENSEQRRFGDEQSINYIGKLTYLASSDHRLGLTVTGTPTKGGGDASFPLRTRSTQRGIFSGLNWATGTFNAFHIESSFDSLDITGELHSSFLDKKLLLDVRVGWHHQNDSGLPGDGSGLDIENRDTLAGTPRGSFAGPGQHQRGDARRSGPGEREGRLQRHQLRDHRLPVRGSHAPPRDPEVRQLPGSSGDHLSPDRSRPPRVQGWLRRADQQVLTRTGLLRRGGLPLGAGSRSTRRDGLRLPALREPLRRGHHRRCAAPDLRRRLGHSGRFRPGQLEHPGQGHPQHRAPLRRAHHQGSQRGDRNLAHRSDQPTDRSGLGSHPAGAGKAVRQLWPLLRVHPPWTSPPGRSAPRRRFPAPTTAIPWWRGDRAATPTPASTGT